MSEIAMTDSNDTVEYMLTTVDNPFNPFTQPDEWLTYDIRLGYNSAQFLDRIINVSPDLSEPDQARIINEAIDEIVAENVSGMWRKVSENSTFPVV